MNRRVSWSKEEKAVLVVRFLPEPISLHSPQGFV